MRELPLWRSHRISAVAARSATAETSDHASAAGNASAARDPLQSPKKALLLRLSAVAACCSALLHRRCRRSGHWERGSDHRNHHRSYRYFSSAVRPCLASRCCLVTGAAVAPFSRLFVIPLRLCLEAVVAAGMVNIDVVAVE
ncbi:uncharacterized protein DS421_17g591490 [Arachis hypogaea]|nr:uncharacterized protein DS421_17g591490 [Arachis hypogaea]